MACVLTRAIVGFGRSPCFERVTLTRSATFTFDVASTLRMKSHTDNWISTERTTGCVGMPVADCDSLWTSIADGGKDGTAGKTLADPTYGGSTGRRPAQRRVGKPRRREPGIVRAGSKYSDKMIWLSEEQSSAVKKWGALLVGRNTRLKAARS